MASVLKSKFQPPCVTLNNDTISEHFCLSRCRLLFWYSVKWCGTGKATCNTSVVLPLIAYVNGKWFQIYKLQYFLLNRAAGFGREQFRHQLGCNRTSNIELFNQKNFSFETNKIDYFWLLTTTLRPFKPLWRKKCDFLQQKTIFKLNLLLRETSIWSHVVTGTNQSNHFESFTLLIFLSFLTAF